MTAILSRGRRVKIGRASGHFTELPGKHNAGHTDAISMQMDTRHVGIRAISRGSVGPTASW